MNDDSPTPTCSRLSDTDFSVRYPPFIIRQGWIWSLKRLIRVFTEPFKRISRWKVVPLGTLATTVPSQTWQLGEFSFDWQGASALQSSLRIIHRSDPRPHRQAIVLSVELIPVLRSPKTGDPSRLTSGTRCIFPTKPSIALSRRVRR